MDRRQFLRTSAGVAAFLAAQRKAQAYAVSMRVTKFNTPLRRFGVEIPIASPDTATYPGIDYYEIQAGAYQDMLHPDLYAPGGAGTRLYGYRQTNMGGTLHKHLGTAVVAMKDRPVRIKFACNLPASHILPFDNTIPQGPMGTPLRQNAAAIHLHGGLVPWPSDGGPFHWISTDGAVGSSLIGTAWLPDANGVLTNDYFYPNHQSARFSWYHDHAIGITRTNAYAGIATGYIIVDSAELAMAGAGLPVPGDILVVQDKVFWDPVIDPGYAQWAGPTTLGGAVKGDLWYPYIYDPKIWGLMKGGVPPVPSCVAEMFGDTMLVNGTPYPFMNVAGRHRLRLLNACNSRFLNLSFAVENPNNPGEPKISAKRLPLLAPVSVWQIGTEGGFLPAPVLLVNNGVPVPGAAVLLGPGERVDLIVDFTNAAGANVILYNDAGAPFPGGSPLFDYSTQTNNAKPGVGPNTRTLLQFRVGAGGPAFPLPAIAGANPVLATVLDQVNGGLKLAANPGDVVAHGGINYTYVPTTQEVTLNEAIDPFGRLSQLIGNVNNPGGMLGSPYWDGPGEQVNYRTIQIWNIYNLTADTHPMHFHLFNVMVLRRRPFNVKKFTGIPVWTALGRGPDPGEEGWKETVKMHPGECTTVAALIEDPFYLPDPGTGVFGNPATRTYTFKKATLGGTVSVTSNPVPSSPRLAAMGVTGDEYVWHCHILEHEEHDMMHSLAAS